jgi:hypothetical protein
MTVLRGTWARYPTIGLPTSDLCLKVIPHSRRQSRSAITSKYGYIDRSIPTPDLAALMQS